MRGTGCRTLRGKLIYTSRKPERMNEERGREYFTLTQQPDGVDLLLAHCEIDDEPAVIRDICQALDHRTSAPRDCSVRLTVGNQFEGSGWFHFADDRLIGESFNRTAGRISEQIEIEKPIAWMQCHPIVGDALLMKIYDLSQGPGKQHVPEVMLSSPDHRGASGPQFFRMSFSIVYLGEEDVEVAAGHFRARHFQVTDTAEGGLPEEHPPYDLWCTADEDYIFLKAGAAGYMQTHYELVELVIE
ncbi:MAG: hypothetical protein GDA55_02765 [Cellvibrionales bacterium]|nr:hypothetical protein [Cellvibrionales bacterium]